MLVPVKPRFVDAILKGVKVSTIRAERKDGRVAKVGETLYFYKGSYTNPDYIKIGEGIVTSVMPIIIKEHWKYKEWIFIGENEKYAPWMSEDSMEYLANIEGFDSLDDMVEFFDIRKNGEFIGHQYLFRLKNLPIDEQQELPMKARA